jgi:hypothetical protein
LTSNSRDPISIFDLEDDEQSDDAAIAAWTEVLKTTTTDPDPDEVEELRDAVDPSKND